MGTSFATVEAVRIKRENESKRILTQDEQDERTKQWCTFFRRNIDLYAEYGLDIELRPFQRIMLYLMGMSQVFFGICSRGISKTFVVGLFCMCKCLLYPYSEIVITASTLDQGATMVKEKILKELIGKLSPVLKYYHEIGYIKVNVGKDDVRIEFFNGSSIVVLPPMDSSRGRRATVLVYDECRTLKKGDITSIFEPMSHPRQARYLSKEKYVSEPKLQEECISIYITSARTKAEWFWRQFKLTVVNCFKTKEVEYNFFVADIFTAIKYGLKKRADLTKALQDEDEINVRMELFNEMLGEAEGALFEFEDFKRNQKLQKAFYPPTVDEFNMGEVPFFREKQNNEKRIIIIDFAFTGTAKGGEKNDNTALLCMSGIYNKGSITRNLHYVETLEGGDTNTLTRIRELYWDYDADYIIFDLQSGGQVHFNNLTEAYEHPMRNSNRWNPCGFGISVEESLQPLASSKLDVLRTRIVDPNAVPILIPMQGTPEFNSIIWQQLKNSINKNKIKFLMDEIEYKNQLNTTKAFLAKSRSEKARELLPFVQTSLLIMEGIEIKGEWSSGKLKVSEPRSGTKDRIIALAYGNYFFHLLENKLAKSEQEEEFTEDDWKNIIIV